MENERVINVKQCIITKQQAIFSGTGYKKKTLLSPLSAFIKISFERKINTKYLGSYFSFNFNGNTIVMYINKTFRGFSNLFI